MVKQYKGDVVSLFHAKWYAKIRRMWNRRWGETRPWDLKSVFKRKRSRLKTVVLCRILNYYILKYIIIYSAKTVCKKEPVMKSLILYNSYSCVTAFWCKTCLNQKPNQTLMITRKWLTLTHAARLSCAILTFTDNFARSPTTHFVTEIRRSAQKCHPRFQPHLCLPPTTGPPGWSRGGGGQRLSLPSNFFPLQVLVMFKCLYLLSF